METPDFEPGRVYFKQFGAERVKVISEKTSASYSKKITLFFNSHEDTMLEMIYCDFSSFVIIICIS